MKRKQRSTATRDDLTAANTHRLRDRIVATVVLIALLVAIAVAAPHHRHSRRRTRVGRSQLQRHLREVQARKHALRLELSRTTHQAAAVATDIHTVDSRIEKTQDQLDATNDRLATGRKEQRTIAEQLADTTRSLEITRAQVRRRLRGMYMQGTTSFLSALVGTKSVGDLASRTTIMEHVARRDRDVFDRYRRLKAEFAERKRKQDSLVVEVAGLARRQREHATELHELRAEKAEALGGLRERQGQLRRLIAQMAADEATVMSEIAAYRARIRSGRGGPALPAFTGRFMRPVNARITSTFGMRYHPVLHYVRLHAGVDFGAPAGTPIMAAAAGRVVVSGYGSGYGNRVIIDHGGGIMTLYGHCSRLFCSAGQMVRQGQRIGAVGSTGLATAAHLHFEVRVNGRPVNPLGRL